MTEGDSGFAANQERFTGFAALYDRFRPGPPAELARLLAVFGGSRGFDLVVDLGSGTGLSTRYWAAHATRVVGIEPTADMRRQALELTVASNVAYREGFSHSTGLPDGCADLVACSQSLHWMEPQPTFEEARRVLKPGGVFAAVDYDWPPTTRSWEAEGAWLECDRRVRVLEKEHGTTVALKHWRKDGHFARMRESGCFRHVKEAALHHAEDGDADRFVGLLMSQGHVMGLLKRGIPEAELGLDRVRETAARTLSGPPSLWLWTALIRMAVV